MAAVLVDECFLLVAVWLPRIFDASCPVLLIPMGLFFDGRYCRVWAVGCLAHLESKAGVESSQPLR